MSYVGNVPTTAAFPFDQFSGNGTTTAFTLSYAPAGTTSIIVSISGVVQNPNTYSVSGTTLTFTPAPPTGTNNIAVLYLGLPVVASMTGTMGFIAGSATNPPIFPIGDTNTGIFFPAADTIAFATAGTEDFRIAPAGQLGIGGANYGTSGQVLTSGGPSAAPSWAASAAFPSGTAMLFVQTSAPTGWTKSTTHDNKALRIVSGTASSGGSVAFTTAFASQSVAGTVGATTLSTAQMPQHSHTATVSDSGHTHNTGAGARFLYTGTGGSGSINGGGTGLFTSVTTASATTGISVSNANNGSSNSHDHSFTGTAINLAVQYVDVIIATKD